MNGSTTTIKNDMLASLLNRGGMLSMMPTVIIIMLALALGGLLTEQGILSAFMTPLVTRIKTQAGVITGTVMTGISANFLIGEQYLATILPGQLWKESFTRLKINPLTLGRSLEDSGTVINYLVPWGVAGSFAAQTLGVSVTSFAPFTFFALLSPVCSLISAWTGIGQIKHDE
jgi:NhaC family Na+:H+ antiporter